MRQRIRIIGGILVLQALAATAAAFDVFPLLKDINSNLYTDTSGPITITRVGFDNNVVRRFTIDQGTTNGGGSFVLAVSNGENGTNIGPGAGNNDVPNPTPVGFAIDLVNGGDGTQGNRLTNGNAFRFSVWMQQDPASPIVAEPSVEPVLKFELWSEAQSTNGDFTSGRAPSATFGDRLWDSDINARDSYYDPNTELSRSVQVDINNNGTLVSGVEPVVSLPPATGVQWVRVETTLVIDDDPDNTGFGWDVAGQGYKVGMIEEVRATFFTGDFTGNFPSLNDGGSFFVDNALLEIFPNKAALDATPNPNPMPVAAIVGDYNDNGSVDAADYTLWRQFLGQSGANLANRSPSVTGVVKQADYNAWKAAFGQGGGGSGMNTAVLAYAPGAAVPEAGTIVLSLLASVGAACVRVRRK
jgi:hypothetical protein